MPPTPSFTLDPDASLFLRFDRAGFVEARQAVVGWATTNGLTLLPLTRFVVAVSEVMANAVQHGGGRGELRLRLAGTSLHCRVTDHGPGIPARFRDGCRHLRRPNDPLGRGTGLWLARQCAEVRISDGPAGGAVVELRYPLPGAPAGP